MFHFYKMGIFKESKKMGHSATCGSSLQLHLLLTNGFPEKSYYYSIKPSVEDAMGYLMK
jgi:hypothetical protein